MGQGRKHCLCLNHHCCHTAAPGWRDWVFQLHCVSKDKADSLFFLFLKVVFPPISWIDVTRLAHTSACLWGNEEKRLQRERNGIVAFPLVANKHAVKNVMVEELLKGRLYEYKSKFWLQGTFCLTIFTFIINTNVVSVAFSALEQPDNVQRFEYVWQCGCFLYASLGFKFVLQVFFFSFFWWELFPRCLPFATMGECGWRKKRRGDGATRASPAPARFLERQDTKQLSGRHSQTARSAPEVWTIDIQPEVEQQRKGCEVEGCRRRVREAWPQWETASV